MWKEEGGGPDGGSMRREGALPHFRPLFSRGIGLERKEGRDREGESVRKERVCEKREEGRTTKAR